MPIIPGTTQFASTTDPSTWEPFETAQEGAFDTPVDGLGFVFTADDPLVGVDLDDCRDPDAERPTAWVAEILDTLNSYAEVSPSGTGYHVLATGTLPDGRNRAGDIELYDRARFFTVTGDHVAVTPETIEARSDAIATVVEEELAPTTSTSTHTASATGETTDTESAAETASADAATASTTAAVPISDDELLERARNAANGEKFTRLWDGTTSGYESHSEADLALCRLLAFWTAEDHSRIDRLFRQSGLYREKWDNVHYADGSTYGEKTIERAVASTDDVYTPPEAESGAAATPAAGSEAATSTTESATTADPSRGDTNPVGDDGLSNPSPTPSEGESLPPTHPERAQARHERIIELTDRIEALMEENDRLRTELEAERQRRHQLEATLEESSGGWWPFANE
ncbi:hypothetical protein C463_08739 [Halorubrum californiense DSM 19288]|uniref:NrS-1 polymerase-like HBD domain-containing protein n=1 Tax=Halorubrum californiense DSM 19288 TaxID=1227465 RepID=M0EBE6_9EURY|nr:MULTISPECIES: hypothetical protein [Halorubrum]ELZ43744.1 hypothetical protein C463_08739 [Halorubrum californiense DSM 19288]